MGAIRVEQIRPMSGDDVLLRSRSEELGMDVVAALVFRLVDFHGNAMRIGPSVLPRTGNLPRDFHIRLVGLYGELVGLNFGGHNRLRELSDRGQLIAEITIQRLKPSRQLDGRIACRIGGNCTVVHMLHVIGFHGGVVQVFVCGVQGIVDLGLPARELEIAGYIYIALKPASPGIATSSNTENSVTSPR